MVGKISDFRIEKIKRGVGRPFIIEHHYSGSCHGGPMCWGLIDTTQDNKLIGVCAFATPISENVRRFIWDEEHEDEMRHHTTGLHRLVTLDSCPHNTESWFVSRCLNLLKEYKQKYKAVISFADTTEGHTGTIYQATNAIYYGMTGENRVYIDKDGSMHSRRGRGFNITREEAKKRGWRIEKRNVKHRYLFLLPDKYESKDDIRSMLDITEQEYP